MQVLTRCKWREILPFSIKSSISSASNPFNFLSKVSAFWEAAQSKIWEPVSLSVSVPGSESTRVRDCVPEYES